MNPYSESEEDDKDGEYILYIHTDNIIRVYLGLQDINKALAKG